MEILAIAAVIGVGFYLKSWWRKSTTSFQSELLKTWRDIVDSELSRHFIVGLRNKVKNHVFALSAADEAAATSEDSTLEDFRKLIVKYILQVKGKLTFESVAKSLGIVSSYIGNSHCFVIPIDQSNTEVNFARRSIVTDQEIFFYTRNAQSEFVRVFKSSEDMRKLLDVFELGLNNGYFWFFFKPTECLAVTVFKLRPSDTEMIVEEIVMAQDTADIMDNVWGTLDQKNYKPPKLAEDAAHITNERTGG